MVGLPMPLRREPTRGVAVAGQIVHIEIPEDDTERGRQFWGSLFGWQFESYPGRPSTT